MYRKGQAARHDLARTRTRKKNAKKKPRRSSSRTICFDQSRQLGLWRASPVLYVVLAKIWFTYSHSFFQVFYLGASDFASLWTCEVSCGQHIYQLQHEAMAKKGILKPKSPDQMHHVGGLFRVSAAWKIISKESSQWMIVVWKCAGEISKGAPPRIDKLFLKVFKGSKQTLNHHSKPLVDCNDP